MVPYTTIAEKLLAKNKELGTVIDNNIGKSYKALEPRISAKICSRIGQQEGVYIKRNLLIWALINAHTDEEEELDY